MNQTQVFVIGQGGGTWTVSKVLRSASIENWKTFILVGFNDVLSYHVVGNINLLHKTGVKFRIETVGADKEVGSFW
jgi:hypothetical protein